MQRTHKYIFIFGGICICYLFVMILVGGFGDEKTNAANKKHSAETVKLVTGAGVESSEEQSRLGGTITTEGAVTATESAVGAKSENAEMSEEKTKSTPKPTTKPTPKPTENPVFYGYRNISKERKAVVNLAKSYVGKLTYLWGGKCSDGDISGKTEPDKLDCSGFIQFIYSKAAGKRIDSLGATVSIANLRKINKSELKCGDIGLKRGTGSLYFDADGNSYTEPSYAENANKKHVKASEDAIEQLEEKIDRLEDKTEDKKDKIEKWKSDRKRVYKKARNLGVTGISEKDGVTFLGAELDTPEKEERFNLYQKKYIAYTKYIEKNRGYVKEFQKAIKESRKQIKTEEKTIKKYSKDVKKRIDHVGIYCGKDKDGKDIWCHCTSSGKSGVHWEHTGKFTHYYAFFNQ